jgi:hypothetical protein
MEINSTAPAALVPAPQGGAMATPAGIGEVTGEMSGLKLLRLGITFGVGGLHDAGFSEGDFVIDKRYRVARKNELLKCIIVGAADGMYKEWLTNEAYQAHKTSRAFPTREAAAAAGLTVDWTDDPAGVINPVTGRVRRLPPQAAPYLELKLLIQRPETCVDSKGDVVNVDMDFYLNFGGKDYLPAIFSADKTGYEGVHVALQNSRIRSAREETPAGAPQSIMNARLHKWEFTLNTALAPIKRAGQRPAMIPVLQRSLNADKSCVVLDAAIVRDIEGILGVVATAPEKVAEVNLADQANP